MSGSATFTNPVSGVRRFFATWEGVLGTALLVMTLLVIVFGPLVAPYPPNELGTGPPNQLPTPEHLLGTDWLGRDVLSRFLVGGRQVLFIPIVAAVVSYLIGGIMAGFAVLRGGALEVWTTRFFDVLLVLPPMLLGLVILGSVGTSTAVMLLLLILVTLPRAGRVIRGIVHAGRGSDYVLAAVGRGESTLYVVTRELAPNVALPVLADFGVRLTYTIIFASSLSFLGFGTQPPGADWGRMVADSVPFIVIQPWGTIAPALGITLAAVAVNLMAEGLGRVVMSDSGSLPARTARRARRGSQATPKAPAKASEVVA